MKPPAIRIFRSSVAPLFDAADRVRRAMRNGVFTADYYAIDGNRFTPTGRGYRSWVSAFYVRDRERIAIRFLASRDVGHHSSGWFKNPDYERCEHLSLSFWDAMHDNAPIAFDRGLADEVLETFFGSALRLIWEEGPKTPEGVRTGAHHFRVFCDVNWQPILPRGEVYSRELTEADWKSWSDKKASEASL